MAVITIHPGSDKREVPAIWADFFTKPTEDAAATKAAGHAVFVDVEWVKWARKGQNLAINETSIARLKKDDPMVWGVLEKYYEAWKHNQEAPVDGVPLKLWPAISASQIKTLNGLGIRSVQELRDMTDGDCDRAGMPGIRNLRQRAKSWLDAANDVGKVAEENIALKAQVEKLIERMNALEAANEQLHSALVSSGKVSAPAIQPSRKAS